MRVDYKSKLAIKLFKFTWITTIQQRPITFDYGKMYIVIFWFTINLL